jgi:hypothetical protein
MLISNDRQQVCQSEGAPVFNKNRYRNLILTLGMGLFMMACGPMNKKAPDKVDKKVNAAQGTIFKSDHEIYAVQVVWTDSDDGQKVKVGDNPCQVRFMKKKDLSSPSDKAEIVGDYSKKVPGSSPPTSPPKRPPMKIDKIENGLYRFNLAVKKAGSWTIHLNLKDGDVTDDFSLDVQI